METVHEIESVLEPQAQTLLDAFSDAAKFAAFMDKVRQATVIKPDLTTLSGREKIASTAYKVANIKSRVDKLRLKLTEDLRAETSRINGIGNRYKGELAELQSTIRAPLDAWEAQDNERKVRVDRFFQTMSDWHVILSTDTSETLAPRIQKLRSTSINPDVFLEREPEAVARASEVHAFLVKAFAELVAKEQAAAADLELRAKEQAELDELRAEKARRVQEDNDRIAREQAERDRIEAERLEQIRIAEASDAAAREAVAKMEAAHQAELDRMAKEQADKDAQEARERQQREDDARRQRDAEDARKADLAHRAAILAEVAADLIDMHEGISEHLAMKIAQKIAAGNVRHTSVSF